MFLRAKFDLICSRHMTHQKLQLVITKLFDCQNDLTQIKRRQTERLILKAVRCLIITTFQLDACNVAHYVGSWATGKPKWVTRIFEAGEIWKYQPGQTLLPSSKTNLKGPGWGYHQGGGVVATGIENVGIQVGVNDLNAFWLGSRSHKLECRPPSFDVLPLFRRWDASDISHKTMNWIAPKGATGPLKYQGSSNIIWQRVFKLREAIRYMLINLWLHSTLNKSHQVGKIVLKTDNVSPLWT